MRKFSLVLAFAAALGLSASLGAHAQSRSFRNSSKPASFPGFQGPLPVPIVTLPKPLPDPIANITQTEINNGIPLATPTLIGNGTLNSSNTLFTSPNPDLSGAF